MIAKIMRWVNKRFRHRLTCGYCNKALHITWKWVKFTKTMCDCPGFVKAMKDKEFEAKRFARGKMNAWLKNRLKGTLLRSTANQCLVCKNPLRRARGQVVFYCGKLCRGLRHNRFKADKGVII